MSGETCGAEWILFVVPAVIGGMIVVTALAIADLMFSE